VTRILRPLVLVALLALTLPVRSLVERSAPPRPPASRTGLGPLAGGVVTGPLRPLLLNYLWIRADTLCGKGRLEEARILYEVILDLYPRNEPAREFLGWLLAWNLKNDAPNDEAAWRHARDGLNILVEFPRGRRTAGWWFLQQCGQNVFRLQRYAGAEWERERAWRARARAWAEARLGEPLDRFEIAERLLPPGDRARLKLLWARSIEEFVFQGRSPLAADVVRELGLLAEDPKSDAWEASLVRGWRDAFRELGEGRPPALAEKRYDFGIALYGIGVHRRDLACLRAARALFEGGDLLEEQGSIEAWILWLEKGAEGPPPPLLYVVR
jgi:hypothetical protein